MIPPHLKQCVQSVLFPSFGRCKSSSKSTRRNAKDMENFHMKRECLDYSNVG